jgi:hypothetical protein
MENADLKVFRLLYSGEIKEEAIENGTLIGLFSNFSILIFYIRKNKHLYTWIGEDASRTLKNYIVNMRQTFSKEYPHLRVLRYITADSIDTMSENNDFFKDIKISKEKIIKHLELEKSRHEEEFKAKLKNLKEQADSYFENENFEKAIETSKTIIELATETKDEKLIEDQKAFIAEAEARLKSKSISEEIRENDMEIITSLREKGKDSLNKGALIDALKYFEEIKVKINNLLNNTRDNL